MARRDKNPTSIHEDEGSIPVLAQWVKGFIVTVSCSVGFRYGSDLALLWLWYNQQLSSNLTPSLGTSMCHTQTATAHYEIDNMNSFETFEEI